MTTSRRRAADTNPSPTPQRAATPPPSSSQTHRATLRTAEEVKQKMLSQETKGFYAGKERLTALSEYYGGGPRNGDVLVIKGIDIDVEFIVRGVFQISRNDFYFTADANFDPANVFHGKFADVKLSCRLSAARSEEFKWAAEDYSTAIDNIRSFEKMIGKETGSEVTSIIQETLGKPSIKLTHSLFQKKTDPDNEAEAAGEAASNAEAASTDTLEDLGPDFSMERWPVADRCKAELQNLLSTHDIQPLPAYDKSHALIPPHQYESKLKGALVEVYIAFYHHHIKKSRRRVFNASLRELLVVRPPSAMPASPFKRARLSDGPVTAVTGKGKQCA
ncbi:hypothetical protein PAXINDRAFT_17803 [Paxillus involutus ATCC 200175]|uniref:Uncharacterized protein n=1 Tax=Paxillus involutus ATCC 200175 TaxID=664439 RepID=A0A0C9TPJ3_PAXIN|nr:hypothetical protein PAXINDRAFT_17803 [Paxillus involutus ATCC 200175]